MRVLYVNHTAHVSGAEEALCDLVAALPDEIEPLAAVPRGPLHERLSAAGVPVFEIPATAGSLRLHPLHTPRALGELAAAAARVRRLSARLRADVVHANSLRAGLAAVAAGTGGGLRPLVHVHDCLPHGPVASLTHAAIATGAAAVVANSRYTAARLGERARPRVVYYGVDSGRFDPARVDREEARRDLGVDSGDPAIGVVGQLTPWKGQDHAIRVLARLRQRHPAARLVLAGSAKFVNRATRFDNRAYVRGLHGLAASLGVSDRVAFAGEVRDVPRVLRALDVVLVPSWEEPFGRAVTEALAMEVPVVATAVGGPREVVVEAETGFLREPRDLAGWTDAVQRLIDDPELRAAMGRRGRAHVERQFPVRRYVEGVTDAYEAALFRRRRGRA